MMISNFKHLDKSALQNHVHTIPLTKHKLHKTCLYPAFPGGLWLSLHVVTGRYIPIPDAVDLTDSHKYALHSNLSPPEHSKCFVLFSNQK